MKRIGWPTRITELPDKGGKMPPREPGTMIVALDEKGEQLGSLAFAERLRGWRDEGRRETRFLIGAADGLAAEVRADAALPLAFGTRTGPPFTAPASSPEHSCPAPTLLPTHPP